MNIVSATYRVEEKPGTTFKGASEIYNELKGRFNPLQEEFFIIPTVGEEFLIEKLFVGGLDASLVDLKTLFRKIMTEYPNCRSFVIAHNHPSGGNEPSMADIDVTRRITKTCELMDYRLLDHIVFSNTGYYSFNDHGDLK